MAADRRGLPAASCRQVGVKQPRRERGREGGQGSLPAGTDAGGLSVAGLSVPPTRSGAGRGCAVTGAGGRDRKRLMAEGGGVKNETKSPKQNKNNPLKHIYCAHQASIYV